LYAVLRADLHMPPGKLAAQAGHAFLQAFCDAQQTQPELALTYHARAPGIKIVLSAPDLTVLTHVYDAVQLHPRSWVIDSEHVLLPHFTGDPVVTAVGFLAPADQVRHITRHLQKV
jgi:peptidyl-tRNA hydrolase